MSGGAAPRIEIVRGGQPSDAEITAIAAALRELPEDPRGRAEVAGRRRVGWRRAGLIEGIGGPPVVGASDLAGRPTP